jgi:HlyD family secretion protein
VSSNVFRKVSLDRLSSPEQLDELMRVTDPKGWVLLAAFAVVVGTAIVWGVFGSLPHDVAGTGMLVKSGGVFEVITLSGGRITDMAVRVGDVVTEGQVVARLSQPELADQLNEAKAVLSTLKAQHEQIVAHGSQDVALHTRLLAQQRTNEEQAMAAADASARWYEEKIGIQQKLVEEGLLTRQTLLNTRQQLDASRQRVSEGRSQLAQIEVRELDLRTRRAEEVRASQVKIDAQERSVATLASDMKGDTEIAVQHTGRILEIIQDQGAVVAKGTPILTLDLMGRTVKELEAIFYVPSAYGKQIKVGMPAYIAPSTVKREEYGLMLGRVTYVSDYPASSKGMLRVLKNDKLVNALSGGDAPYEVHADLLVDESTVSNYRWSSSSGPPLRIQSGTFAHAQITVDARRPIEMVIPLLREYTGL